MPPRRPIEDFATHAVQNQPPPLGEINLFGSDPILSAAVGEAGLDWALPELTDFGARLGSEEVQEWGRAANRYPPELKSFDRYGRRIDEVIFHPAYHQLMELGVAAGLHSIAWTAERPGGHLAHLALEYMLVQVEAGVCCPLTMSYAALPCLRQAPGLAADWTPRLLSDRYDPRPIPAPEKRGVTMGMAMTEKQGGSDVRANSTRAVHLSDEGPAPLYGLTGHKWFCSAPMSDAFFTLAQTDQGLSCFLVPRWRPDGSRNPFLIQRLKEKLGNHANASSEIEYLDTWGYLVGEAGRGVPAIIEMVHHTRLDTALAAAGLMRQALVQAAHHCAHRSAFQKRLIDQPLMESVLADMTLDWLASTLMVVRVAQAFDRAENDPDEAAFARIAVALAKYWINKRLPNFTYEAMECLGGSGYVEDSPLPRLYREAPLNSIWEGSGNVICLDVLRALKRSPAALEAFQQELELAKGLDPNLDRRLSDLQAQLTATPRESDARRLAEAMALAWQAGLVLRQAPEAAAKAYAASRLAEDHGLVYGALPAGLPLKEVVGLARVGA